MILSLILVTLLIPVFATVALVWLISRFSPSKIALNIVAQAVWLSLYFWIVQIPSFPPKQALDWVWIYVLTTGLTGGLSKVFYTTTGFLTSVNVVVFVGLVVTVLWPVLSYEATLSSHWLVWFEFAIFAVVASCILWQQMHIEYGAQSEVGGVANQRFKRAFVHLWLVSGVLGFIVAITGSLLIATLLGAFSATQFALWGYSIGVRGAKAHGTFASSSLSYGIVLLMLIITRAYVEIDVVVSVLLLFSVMLSVYLQAVKANEKVGFRVAQAVFYVFLLIAATTALYMEVITPQPSGYY